MHGFAAENASKLLDFLFYVAWRVVQEGVKQGSTLCQEKLFGVWWNAGGLIHVTRHVVMDTFRAIFEEGWKVWQIDLHTQIKCTSAKVPQVPASLQTDLMITVKRDTL